MATELLLMSDVENLGAAGDVVRVTEGYARNFLLPRKLAAPVTEGMRRRLAKIQQARAVELQRQRDDAQALARKLAGVSCTIPAKTATDQKLYGSVGIADIVSALQAQGIVIGKDQVMLEAPFKELGIFNVPVKLHAEVTASVKVWVVEE